MVRVLSESKRLSEKSVFNRIASQEEVRSDGNSKPAGTTYPNGFSTRGRIVGSGYCKEHKVKVLF
jgi:hypothetical protein